MTTQLYVRRTVTNSYATFDEIELDEPKLIFLLCSDKTGRGIVLEKYTL